MKKIINYSQYNTQHIEDPKIVFLRDELYESKGVPNVLKAISKELVAKIIDNRSIIYDYNYDNFNVTGTITKHNYDKFEIYATSRFGYYYKRMENTQIDVYLPESFEINDLERVIMHELLHIYEIFNRLKSKTDKDLQWGLVNVLQKVRIKYNDKFIQDLMYLIYLSSDQEINARVSETYTILMEFKTQNSEILINELVKCKSWEYSNILENFKIDNRKIDYLNLREFLTELNSEINNKYKTNFNIYKIPNSDKDCDFILKKWIELFKKKGTHLKNKLKKVVDEVINDVRLVESATLSNDDVILNKKLNRNSKIFKLNRY